MQSRNRSRLMELNGGLRHRNKEHTMKVYDETFSESFESNEITQKLQRTDYEDTSVEFKNKYRH